MSRPHVATPAYRIETERLVLRCWQFEDAALMQKAAAESREHLLNFMPWAVHEPEPVEAKAELIKIFRDKFERAEDFTFGVFPGDESHALGGCGLHTRIGEAGFEIGYWIHKDFIGQGFATELSAALTRVGFELYKAQRLEIHCAVQNFASAAVPRKLGYVHEATRRRLGFAYGGSSDSMIWTLFIDEYPSTPSAHAILRVFDKAGNRLL